MSAQDWRTLAAGLGISAVGCVALAGIAWGLWWLWFSGRAW